MVELLVDDRIRVPVHELPDAARAELRLSFEHPNPKWRELQARGYGAGGEPETYRTWREERGCLALPRGGMRRVREVLRRHGVAYAVRDERTEGSGPRDVPDLALKLRPYQREAVDAMARRENCLLRAGQAAGKTTCAFALAARLKLPTLVIVNSGALFEQWQERAERELGFRAGSVRGDKRELRALTVAMQQSLASQGVDEELRRYFGVLIYDEVQQAAARTVFQVIDPFPARYRFGVSADEGRKDKKEFLTHDLFGEAAYEISREQLADEGHVLEVEVRVVPTAFKADWYRAKMQQAQRWRGRRGNPHGELLSAMGEDAERNELIVATVKAELDRGERAFVFSDRVEHCRRLDAAIASHGHRSGLMLGGKAMERELERTKAALLSGEYRAGVGTIRAIGTGTDVPPVSVAAVCTPIIGNKQLFAQVRGRVSRPAPGKEGARCYVFHDPLVLGKKAVRDLAKWNRRVIVWHRGAWVAAKDYLAQTGAA